MRSAEFCRIGERKNGRCKTARVDHGQCCYVKIFGGKTSATCRFGKAHVDHTLGTLRKFQRTGVRRTRQNRIAKIFKLKNVMIVRWEPLCFSCHIVAPKRDFSLRKHLRIKRSCQLYISPVPVERHLLSWSKTHRCGTGKAKTWKRRTDM